MAEWESEILLRVGFPPKSIKLIKNPKLKDDRKYPQSFVKSFIHRTGRIWPLESNHV